MPLEDPALEYEEEDLFGEEEGEYEINTAAPVAVPVPSSSSSLAPPPLNPSSSPAAAHSASSRGLFPAITNERRRQGDEARERLNELRRRKQAAVVFENTGRGVPSLKSDCLDVIKANTMRIWDVGDLEYAMIRPLLDEVPMEQLAEIETNSPHLKEDTDWLWEVFLLQDYPLFHERCTTRKGEPRTTGWRRMYRADRQKAKQDMEERQSQAVSRVAERYRQLEEEKAAKKIVIMNQLVPDKKRKKVGPSQTSPKVFDGTSGSAAGSMARAREQAKRARVALTHASGKYVPPTLKLKAKAREDQSFKNPYLETLSPVISKTERLAQAGPRLPPPRVRSRPEQQVNSARPFPKTGTRLSPIDLTVKARASLPSPSLLTSKPAHTPKSPIAGSYPTSEHEARRKALPAHLHSSSNTSPTYPDIDQAKPRSKQVEYRRAEVANFQPPVKAGVVVDFFGDGVGAAPKGLLESLARAEGRDSAATTPSNTSSRMPMPPLVAPKRKAEVEPASVLFRKKKKPAK